MEIYTPAYLYNSSGQLATRPTITSVSSSTLGYNSAFSIQTPNASRDFFCGPDPPRRSDACFRHGSANGGPVIYGERHDAERHLTLDGNIAPPGYYLLFTREFFRRAVCRAVRATDDHSGHSADGHDHQPLIRCHHRRRTSRKLRRHGTASTGSIASYDWVFPGGSPSSSTAANPGSVTFATPGTYVVSFDVTDSSGRTDPDPPTRTITVVPGFSISAAPSTRSVTAGQPHDFHRHRYAWLGLLRHRVIQRHGPSLGSQRYIQPRDRHNFRHHHHECNHHCRSHSRNLPAHHQRHKRGRQRSHKRQSHRHQRNFRRRQHHFRARHVKRTTRKREQRVGYIPGAADQWKPERSGHRMERQLDFDLIPSPIRSEIPIRLPRVPQKSAGPPRNPSTTPKESWRRRPYFERCESNLQRVGALSGPSNSGIRRRRCCQPTGCSHWSQRDECDAPPPL